MKISLRWVLDHIDVLWEKFDATKAVRLFNEKTAEIEFVEHKKINKENFSIIKVDEKNNILSIDATITQKIFLESAHDNALAEGYYLVVKDKKKYRIATERDLGGTKETFLPSLYYENDKQAAEWSKSIHEDDIVLDIDNKSITHRPDLWSHRGIARELAALMNLGFKEEKNFLQTISEKTYEDAVSLNEYPVAVSVQTPKCTRFSALYFEKLATKPSALWMVNRLSCIDERAINLTVDATNYVLFDIGQPLHAFDAKNIEGNAITISQKVLSDNIQKKDKLFLLDGQEITVLPQDIIISDNEKPLALAGIKGGKCSGITGQTKQVFLEAAHFDAATIRQTGQYHKLRTNASARFEKAIDSSGTTLGIGRFLKLIESEKVPYVLKNNIITIGAKQPPKFLEVEHEYIVKKIGIEIEQSFIVKTLEKIGFKVVVKEQSLNKEIGSKVIYTIRIPSYRATKDITIKDDIVEEIVRFYGYGSLARMLPKRIMQPHGENEVRHKVQSVKEFFAYSMKMRELYSYAFYDETFLESLRWQPVKAVTVKKPVSEKYKRLVTSLIPGILQALVVNHKQEKMNFFELGNIWIPGAEEGVLAIEKASLAGVFFDKNAVDFYEFKKKLVDFFKVEHLDIIWHQIKNPISPWYMPYQTAELRVEGKVIGVAGKIMPSFLHAVIEGDAFVFEIDATALFSYKKPMHRYEPLPKYEAIMRDVTIELPLFITAEQCIKKIEQANGLIASVSLRDIFMKKEWVDTRALTFRFTIQPNNKTLIKEEIEVIEKSVNYALNSLAVSA